MVNEGFGPSRRITYIDICELMEVTWCNDLADREVDRR